MRESLQSLSYDELRNVWKDFLATLDVADSTKTTMYTDAFYLWRHNDKELFWNIVLDDNFEEAAKRNISNTLIRDSRGDKATLINGYYYHLKKFREFVLNETVEKTYNPNAIKVTLPKVEESKVPYPCVCEIEKYLDKWDRLENYHYKRMH